MLGCSVTPDAFEVVEASSQGPLLVKNKQVIFYEINQDQMNASFQFHEIMPGNLLAFPIEPLDPGINFVAKDGDETKEITIRSACLLFLAPEDWGFGIYKKCLDSDEILISSKGVSVLDYSASFSGEFIYFSSTNPSGGVDISRMRRDGSEVKKMVDCSSDDCVNPKPSPDETLLAFWRKGDQNTVEIIRIDGNETIFDSVASNENSQIAWSWTGKFFSFNDSQNRIQILDSENGFTSIADLPKNSEGTWAKFSNQFIYTYPIYWGGIPNYQIDQFNAVTKETRRISGGGSTAIEFGAPYAFTPLDIIILSYRSQNGGSAKQLCRIEKACDCLAFSSDQRYSYTPFGFDPTGRYFVFQRFEIGNSGAKPQIGFLDIADYSDLIISEGGRYPQWLP
jgi:hypothetical protein